MPREARGERAESEKVGVSEALHKEQRAHPVRKSVRQRRRGNTRDVGR